MPTLNPILNNPYEEPTLYYDTDSQGNLDYSKICSGRRMFKSDIPVIPVRQQGQKEFFEWNEDEEQWSNHLINLTRKEVGKWRASKYSDPNPTRVTKELLTFWFLNPDRIAEKKLFFAQQEAIETSIWLNEIAEKSNAGQNILNLIKAGQRINGNDALALPRVAFKMATGTGKTVVMAAQILYHYFNRLEYRNDTRFADHFLIVAPGITIKDRLGVLFVDTENKNPNDIQDYYHLRGLVPQNSEEFLNGLNAKLVITNYHGFEPRTLQGNKRSPFDGKLDADGNKQEAKEDFSQVIKRLLGKFKPGSRLLIINDEAHHCYYPKEKGRAGDEENSQEENERAAIWYTGLMEVSKKFQVRNIYDLSATPYFLHGSGYRSYSLFPWVTSDFGLIEAIESGLVKIPFLPESDNTQELDKAKLSNIYEYVKTDLPKKGQKTKKAEAKKAGKKLKEEAPQLPHLVKAALDQFYTHYEKDFNRIRSLFDNPPVFIIVCNNTTVSKEVYKFIAGYDIYDEEGEIINTVTGMYPLFNNYESATKKPIAKPPTLLIDSDALENSDQVNDDFKKIFAAEIENFKRDYRIRHQDKSVENITDAEILREVVNTVGKKGALGSHIRCVVSVSMLTEGWDANTVTHIMGIRAFGSQLLCEQVAGRALRRKNYFLQPYNKEGIAVDQKDLHRYKEENLLFKFSPEYAHIIGVPFRMFKSGTTEPPEPPDYKYIFAMPERQEKFEITFPNIVGYRVETQDEKIRFDFSSVENYELDGTKIPTRTEMSNAFTSFTEQLTVEQVKNIRRQTLIYAITKDLLLHHFADDDKNLKFGKFNELKEVVDYWYDNKVFCIGDTFKQMLYYENARTIIEHIYRGIIHGQKSHVKILPVFNHYNPFSSTKYVNGHTSREVYETKRSHVNYVVADTESWEQIAAKTFEEINAVQSYVKNAFLGFTIPYVHEGKDRQYFPDFIVRCKTNSGNTFNLIVEVTGMNKDKAVKKDYVMNRWLPAVNAVREKYEFDEWHFVEIANDIRYIKNQLSEKIQSIT